jgi:hypothetical protein
VVDSMSSSNPIPVRSAGVTEGTAPTQDEITRKEVRIMKSTITQRLLKIVALFAPVAIFAAVAAPRISF